MTQQSKHRAKHRAKDTVRTRRILGSVGTLTALTVLAGATTGVWGDTAPTAAHRRTAPAVAVAQPQAVPRTQPEVDVDSAVVVAKKRESESLPDLSKMGMAQLQKYAVRMQTEFVQASLAYEEAQTQAEQAQQAAEDAEDKAEQAQADEVQAREQAVHFVVATYTDGLLSQPTLKVLTSGEEASEEVLGQMTTAQQINDIEADKFEQMRSLSETADTLAERASLLREKADAAQQDAQVLLDDIQGRASKVASAANKALLDSSDQQALFASAEQQARNDAALAQWRDYLSQLDRAHVVPPAAKSLRPGAKMPYGLKPLTGAHGERVLGMAAKKYRGKTLTVLPRETIAAVSRAFAALGVPYVAGNAGPDSYDCSGLTASVFEPGGFALDASSPVHQYQQARLVAHRDAQVGDLVFFDTDKDGIQYVGINLGGRLMVSADAQAQQVGVQRFPSKPFAVARVTLPAKGTHTAPKTRRDALTRCGGDPALSAGNSMVYPMKKGTYELGSEFGQAGHLWSSGYHTGQDFVAATGTPVMAAKGGVVTVSKSSWGGPNFVTIDHGDGLQTAYGHMSQAVVHTGDVVNAGDLIGAVGALGNVTGPHLHFEVLVGGVKVDPMLFLSGSGSGVAGWGGFTNGMIPDTELCGLAHQPGHQLRCDAAAAFNSMATAYRKAMGSPLCITDSYRSYAAQVTLFGQKPSLAAVPGTSNHGWALAVDLCGGIESWGTKQRGWMEKNAGRFGWFSPHWAQPGNGREEPWHWEFGHIS